MTGDITVISGPTAVGKGTVVSVLKERCPDVWVSVSTTTRPPRCTERDGVDYLFVSDAEFDALVETDGLLEWACVHGVHRYGTPAAPVFNAIAEGRHVILEIDLQGSRQVRQSLPDVRSVFIAPPTWDDLVQRLIRRGTEDEQACKRRLETARKEMSAMDEFDHVVINDEVGRTVDELVDLLGLTTTSGTKVYLEQPHS